MTYAAAGRHHYNFQTSDEIASPPFFPLLVAPASTSPSEESLFGTAWTKWTHSDHAVLLLSLSVEVEVEVPDRLGSRLTYYMHAVSNGRKGSNGTKYLDTVVVVLSLRPSRVVYAILRQPNLRSIDHSQCFQRSGRGKSLFNRPKS